MLVCSNTFYREDHHLTSGFQWLFNRSNRGSECSGYRDCYCIGRGSFYHQKKVHVTILSSFF